ncbi:MAG TPA: TonB-dependent receptor [Deltaproteobacteria bacterium]|nr:TonB-dependent receptor [Deltaproteobacteria bacterium]HQB39254.1 TonB-dependent receptor [Deltaproteobacteria bacterium]
MHKSMTLALLALSLPMAVGNAAADVAKDGKQAGQYSMGEMVVTSDKLEEYIKNYPQDVSFVARDEIVKRNLSSVEEVLKVMPGVEVYPTTGIGTRISLRGSGKSSGVLILLNGRPLNSNNSGSMDLNAIPVEIIESITVFKPPIPVWLGPGGSDGAINIVTREVKAVKTSRQADTTIRAAGGSYGLFQGGLSQVVRLGDSSLLLSGNYNHRDGKRLNSGRNDGNASFNWNRKAKSGNKYEISGRYYEAEYGVPGPIDNPTPLARQHYRKGSLGGRMSGALLDNGTYNLNAYGDITQLKDKSQYGYSTTLDDSKGGLKADTSWSDAEGKWELRLGGMSEYNRYEHTLAGRHERYRNGLNTQFDKRLGRFTATVGARADVTNDFGFEPSGMVGLGWGVTDSMLVKARVGYTVNVPTFEQLYQPVHGSIDQSRGNPNLKEERVLNYDLSLEYKLAKNSTVQLTLFRVNTYDLITSQRGADLIYRPTNIPGAERQGMEFTGKYDWGSGLISDVSVIYQNSKNRDTGKDLPYTPDIKMKTTLQYTLPKLKTRLEGTLRYEGVRYSQAENLGSQKMSDYITMDMRVTQSVTIGRVKADIYARIDNLFDACYQGHFGHPDDGIRAVGGVQMRF